MDKKKQKIIIFIFCIVIFSIISFLVAPTLIFFMEKIPIENLKLKTILSMYKNLNTIKIFLLLQVISVSISLIPLIEFKWYTSKQIKITDDIYIPVSAGQNQHGSAKFMQKKDYDDMFEFSIIDISKYKNILKNANNIYNFIENNKDKIDELIDDMDNK